MSVRSGLSAALLITAALALSACSTLLPSLEQREESRHVTATADSRIGKALAPLLAEHPGMSGVHALPDGRDAFAARVLLAQAAEHSLDVQYYIWHKDITGVLLFNALRAAADRGVRVRLLLDDNNTAGLDPMLLMLDAHPNIEVRLFNPFLFRPLHLLGYLTDFRRLNRRMHNKSFTVDNQASIVGGRNIGDEYFGAAGPVLFADLDVMTIGVVVDTISQDFDRYWNSRSAYPLALLATPAEPAAIGALLDESARVERSEEASTYMEALRRSDFAVQLLQHTLSVEWADALLLSDDPAKALHKSLPEARVSQQLRQLLGDPAAELDLVSPYFVPSQASIDALTSMAQRGVKVRILTNSLEATDVAAVHAGYAKWRKPLLEAGVNLFELRRQWSAAEAPSDTGIMGSSASSLHAKTFSADRRRVFIGSFNFDLRSAELNTEMGLVIDSPALALQIASVLERNMPAHAYRVRLNAEGQLYWTEQQENDVVEYSSEPGASYLKLAWIKFLSLLPIDWML